MNGRSQRPPADTGPTLLRDRRLTEVPLTFVDVETTGLSPGSGDRVCEIALIRCEPNVPERTFVSLIDPQRPVSPGAFRVNGITEEMLDGAPTFDAIIDEVEAFIDGSVIVAHNAPFDLGFLRSEFEHCARSFPELPVIDTLYLARNSGRFVSCSLGSLAQTLGIDNDQAHRALGDTRTTRKIFAALIADFFPPPLSPLVSELIELPFAARLSPAEVGELPEELAALVERRQPFSLVYRRAEGTVSNYHVRVDTVGRLGPHLYLSARIVNRELERHFRLDRILSWRPYNDMTTTADIRPMAEAELALLHDLWDAAELSYRPKGRDTVERMSAERAANPGGFIGAFEGERLVGFVLASDDGRRGWINRLAVHPDRRRTGLGGRLILAAEAELRGRGMMIIAALIEEENAASRGAFEKQGFTTLPEVLYYSKRDSWDV